MFLGHEFGEVAFDLLRRFVRGESEPLGNAGNVRVHNHARCYSKSVAENDVRGLSSDAAECEQFIHRSWYLAAVDINYPLTRRLNVLCLVPKKAGRVNIFFEFLLRD